MLDDHIIGSLPQVEDGVTVGILGDPNRRQGPQRLQQLTTNPGKSVRESNARVPEQQPFVSQPSEPIQGEAADFQEPSLLIGAMHGISKAFPEQHVDSAGVAETELQALPHAVSARRESGCFDDAPEGFTLVAKDLTVW